MDSGLTGAFMTDRAEVFDAINSERAYQNQRWGVTPNYPTGHNPHSVTEWLVYMQHYVNEGLKIATMSSKRDDPESRKALEFVRKVAALGIVAMEEHGAPRREGF